MSSRSKLQEYRKKRNFRRTSEPSGGKKRGGSHPIFVIQKHDASRLHYDFRIEADGVLKSWAVPKGPSTDPREKRLAVPTEDHPLDYAGFEGVIPEDQYGAGTVMIWDRGPYRNLKKDDEGGEVPVEKSIHSGHVTIDLQGEKIKGGYALIRTGKGKHSRWLLVKMDDEHADARRNPVSTQPESVATGRTLKQIAREEEES
jgi:DNA ligase D-like protein (predicted 3'-phosphoesterase)